MRTRNNRVVVCLDDIEMKKLDKKSRGFRSEQNGVSAKDDRGSRDKSQTADGNV